MTQQKRAVLEALHDAGRTHPTAESIFFLAKAHLPGIALGTVYRNLAIMSESEEIKKINVPGSADRYDFVTDRHDHVVCIQCGKVFDLPHGAVYIPDGDLPDGMTLVDSELVLRCLCSDCQKATGSDKIKNQNNGGINQWNSKEQKQKEIS